MSHAQPDLSTLYRSSVLWLYTVAASQDALASRVISIFLSVEIFPSRFYLDFPIEFFHSIAFHLVFLLLLRIPRRFAVRSYHLLPHTYLFSFFPLALFLRVKIVELRSLHHPFAVAARSKAWVCDR